MEYTPEIIIVCLLYIGLMNWVYIREYKTPKDKKDRVLKRGAEWD